ncbi:hypothetical protein FHW36_111117 [Chitinophaga polysaccharea]|uniref:PepSY domain-containing protein n=1 Tax=Chitinophaga polysaccharea TaxID=1293035 RepID=A0A561P732_9BACT|nr:hypothetical protein [Chitinophaga polysaccharea]TWF33926.1 hypothetical protein FHW36_111117 [Chitinophaga polysaccharea]
MKKVMNYVLVAGIGLVALGMIPATATGHTMGHRHHMKKEERREERRMRKEEKKHIEIVAPAQSGNMMPQAALPVMETYVPQDVVNKLESKYGSALYDITTLQSVNGVDRYCVRTLNNGIAEAVTVDGSGAPAM